MKKLNQIFKKEIFQIKGNSIKVWHLLIVLFLFGSISQVIENNKVEGEYKSTMYLGDSYVNTYIKLYDDGSMGMNRKSKINGGSEIKQEGSGSWEKLGNNKIYLNTSDSRFESLTGEYLFSPGSLSNSENTFKKN